jgi:hypothetical protein
MNSSIARILLTCAIGLMLAGCAKRVVVSPADIKVLRTFGWESDVPDPEAEWNPQLPVVVARMPHGIQLLREGRDKSESFASTEKKEFHHPAWINANQFVVGPARNITKLDDGQIVPSSEGLVVATVRNRNLDRASLSKIGFRPKVWNGRVVAQVANKLVLIDERGKTEEFGEGFYAEPQRDGSGICWQETPVFDIDYWTAKPRLGRLLIRWKPGKVSEIPGAVAPTWTAGGGVVAIVLSKEPEAGKAWWSQPTTALYLASAKAKPVGIATDVHELAAHPSLPILAAAGNDGRVRIIALDGQPAFDLGVGDRPRWNHDGSQLLVEEKVAAKADLRHLRVYVLKIPGLKAGIVGDAESAASHTSGK